MQGPIPVTVMDGGQLKVLFSLEELNLRFYFMLMVHRYNAQVSIPIHIHVSLC